MNVTLVTHMIKCFNKSMASKKSQTLLFLALYNLLQKKEYEDINIKELCEKANVSRMSFYRSFSSKDDILIGYCDDAFEDFFNSFLKVNNPSGYDLILAILTFWNKNKRQIKVLQKANKMNLLMPQFSSYARYILSKLDTTELQYIKKNPLTVPIISSIAFAVLIYWLENDFKYTPVEMANYILHLYD